MKPLLIILALSLSTIFLQADTLPPKNLRAPWSELEDFADWKITKFTGWAIPFDGGSRVFFFQTALGDHFEVMAANPAYWTTEEKKAQKQVFFMIRQNRFYRIKPGSEQEKNLIRMIREIRPKLSGEGKTDPKLLDSLTKRISDRKPIFKTKG